MKILMFTPFFYPEKGGCINRVDMLAKYFKKFGHEPVVVAPIYNEEFDDSKLPYPVLRERLFISKKDFIFFSSIKKVRRIVKQVSPDVIYNTIPPGYLSFIVAFAKKFYKKPMLVDIRDPWVEGVKANKGGKAKVFFARLIENYICKKADVISVTSPVQKQLTCSSYKIPCSKVKILYNGADPSLAKNVEALKRKKEWKGKKLFIYTGAYTEVQQLPEFLKFFLPVLKKNKDFHLIIMGWGEDYSKLEKIAKENKQVDLLPPVPKKELMKWIKMADFGLTVFGNKPSLKYMIPIKTFGYTLLGKPVLAYGLQDSQFKKIVEKYKIGVFVNKKNIESKIKKLIKNYDFYSKNARMITRKKFNREVMAKEMLKIMKDIL